jgi:hypothetical protein
LAFELISDEGSLEDSSFLHEHSLSMSSVVEELSIVPASIDIYSLSFAIWHVVLPLTFVFVPSSVVVLSITVCYVVPEVALKVAAILLDIPSTALAPSIDELTFKVVTVIVLDGSETFGCAIFVLADIGSFDGL